MITREEALKRLNLPEEANSYDVERRYTLLSKSMRGKRDEETLKKIEEITEAYDILTGRYVEKPKLDPKMEEVVFGKKRKDWKNIWHYSKWPVFVSVLILILVGTIIYQAVTTPSIDMQISGFGTLYKMNNEFEQEPFDFEVLIQEQNPNLQNLNINIHTITYDSANRTDPQMEQGVLMKRLLMYTGAEPVDILIADLPQLEALMAEGLLLPMDHLYERLEEEKPNLTEDAYYRPVFYTIEEEFLAEGESPEEHVYAFDLSEKQLLNSLDIFAEEQYIGLVYHGENKENAEDVVYQLMASIEEWYDPETPLIDREESDRPEDPRQSDPFTTTRETH